ncbi:hypothetical protein G5V59_25645 [Nocardioides sp. W3-2-3]|uniref:hypothetical protein n=1 Tax=Nocardioides convexus TaxID=2712224 RepID=UPI002418A841|nr:hypothetical protein [Nocardioides convexus]NHA01885.1 hypothetical protein [Nocardioides convexus]
MAAEFSPVSRRLRSRVASLTKYDPNHPDLPDARRDLRAERLADHVRSTLSQLPPLTDEQRDRVASLLRGGAE